MDQCIEIADEFLDEGVVTYAEDKNGKKTGVQGRRTAKRISRRWCW